MKTNLTLKIDKQLLREAKVLAAQQDTSISALIAGQLEKLVRERKGYEAARRRAFALMDEGWDLGWRRPASRDELYDR
jgi:CRISPR/Cas system-associated protein Csm6